ncbi:MAG: hypothetical protein HY235_25150 [Acidobacteria bacterium]|nr:hypothetical protein [Acidobacteriota bacterium]
MEKRFRAGLSFLLAYTGQKLIDDNSITAVVGTNAAPQNIYDRRAERSVSANDVSQVFSLSYVYELPFGKGKRFGGGWNRLTDSVLGRWQVNGITLFQTGQPLAIAAQNTSGAGNAGPRPNNNGHSAKLEGPVESRLSRYFNTTVFTAPLPFTFGNTGRVLPDAGTPGVKNFDFSLFKGFRLVEKVSLQLRAEAFNLANTPQFARPNSNMNNAQFGVISSQANSPRQLQFGLKVLF